METSLYDESTITQAAAKLKQGELIAFPTETVYGLGADATNVAAVKKVYAAKGRPSDNPLIVHIADAGMVDQYAQNVSAAAHRLMDRFWPGPLTLIFEIKSGALSKEVTGGLNTAAFRLPDNQLTRELIRQTGKPIVGPSANTSGKPSPTTPAHVQHDLQGKIAGILDGGTTQIGVESTVLDMSTDQPVILRPGAVTQEQIEAVIGPIFKNQHTVQKGETPKAPGMKYTHYSPTAQVYMFDPQQDLAALIDWASRQSTIFGVMATDELTSRLTSSQLVKFYSLGTNVESASHQLFAGLRAFDNQPEITQIFVQTFQPNGIGEAYMNRLGKAAGGKTFSEINRDQN